MPLQKLIANPALSIELYIENPVVVKPEIASKKEFIKVNSPDIKNGNDPSKLATSHIKVEKIIATFKDILYFLKTFIKTIPTIIETIPEKKNEKINFGSL
ncbi:hypothetical protein MARBORIA2_13950 [Methanobrevibacter arboriphilus]|jgi:hypothetical protein|uniref:Uncharacterized protein n=1 Tax=Methanobrevibacter arboriphilus TaxID=39441 RepID=A0ACA8R0Y1_METAZ|nr:hypothetical protein MarbSA_01400 [Methanobrevibacter arboriphilus]GLI12305.1 hypothetical protein MARBORIA2_13950 [Methanobrevibacter arboriphilus]